MSQFYRIVRPAVHALLVLVAVAALVAVPAAPAPAGVLTEDGHPNDFWPHLQPAGKSGHAKSWDRFFLPSTGSVTISNVASNGLEVVPMPDCHITLEVTNIATGEVVLHEPMQLSNSEGTKTFSWHVPGQNNVTGFNIKLINHGTNDPLVHVVIK